MNSYLGDLYAILTAVSWSIAVIFFRLSTAHFETVPLKIFQNLVTTILFWLALLALGEPLKIDLSSRDWSLLIISAALGITLADTLYIAAIRRIGAGFQAIIDGLYTPSVLLLAYIGFRETVNAQTLLGGSLVLLSIWVAQHDYSRTHISRRDMWIGIALAILSQLSMAACVVILKDILKDHSVLQITAYRFTIGGALLLVLYSLTSKTRKKAFEGFRRWRTWHILMPGIILGTFASTLFWFAGFKHTLAARAAIYNQMSTVFIVLLAAYFFKEPLSPRRWLAVGLGVLGGSIVMWA